jgi:RNA polymerase sigma-70 factor, ECF subfamily
MTATSGGIRTGGRVFWTLRRPQMRQQQVERDLIGRMRARDGSAVADLAATYGPRIQQLAFRYLKNWEDAEEVAQDVLMKVFRKIDAFRGDAALSSWIYRITFNTAMSRLRTARFSRPAEVQTAEIETESNDHVMPEPADWASLADDQVMRAEMRKRLIDALTHLPTVYRVPVLLRDIQGLSTEEASAVLRVKPQTLKSRLHRGRLILRKYLGDFAGGLELHERESVN